MKNNAAVAKHQEADGSFIVYMEHMLQQVDFVNSVDFFDQKECRNGVHLVFIVVYDIIDPSIVSNDTTFRFNVIIPMDENVFDIEKIKRELSQDIKECFDALVQSVYPNDLDEHGWSSL